MNIYKPLYISILSVAILLGATACDKYLDIRPTGQVIPENTSEYRASLNSAYTTLPGKHLQLLNMRGLAPQPEDDPWGMNLDEYENYRTIYTWQDNDDNSGKSVEYPYASFYKTIFFCNMIIADEGKIKSDGTEQVSQIVAEAYALRAYVYFELLNLYGPSFDSGNGSQLAVPIYSTIDTEQTFSRSSTSDVMAVIESDLAAAEQRMKVGKAEEPAKRYRFTSEALYALQARYNLYKGEWERAKSYADKALQLDRSLTDLNKEGDDLVLPTFYNSDEAIWSVITYTQYVLRGYSSLSSDVAALYKEGDLRATKYFKQDSITYYPAKAMSDDEKGPFRRSEIYLIAAESSARLSQVDAAKGYLKTLIQKRYTPDAYTTESAVVDAITNQDDLIKYIFDERRREFAYEGQDWYDFKRNRPATLSKKIKGETFTMNADDPRYTLQIPKSARDANPNL